MAGTRSRLPPAWLVLCAAGALVVASGLLPAHATVDLLRRAGPVLAFLVGVTALAGLADAAELFDVAAAATARLGGGRTPHLFLLVCALAMVTTVALSLDTTAVLLTPVVLALTARLGLRPLPFAVATVWLANTASLLLPVSNLTNLLAAGHLGLGATGFAARMGPTAGATAAATVVVLVALFRRDLSGRYRDPGRRRPADPVLCLWAGAACLAVAPVVLAGVAPWLATVPAAAGLAVVTAARRPAFLRPSLVPWRLVLLTLGLFLVVAAVGRHGLDGLLTRAAGSSSGPAGLLRTAGVGAGAANAVNNLPAYLALERAVTPGQVPGLLLGVNAGPLLTTYGSLATLLWRDRCRARGVHVPVGRFALVGLAALPAVLLSGWLGLLAG